MGWKDRAIPVDPSVVEELQQQSTQQAENLSSDWKKRSATAAPPSQDIPTSSEISPVQAAAIGAGQGITLDWGDELTALLRSAVSNKSYEELQKEYEAIAEQAAKDSPVSYYAGNIGAGLAFNPAGKAIGAGLKAANLGATKAIPALAAIEQAAPAISKVGQMATEGGIYGAAIGAGQASADESLLDKAAEGAKSGFTLGTIIGAGGEALKKVAPAFTKIATEADLPKTLKKIKDVKEAGYDVGSEATIEKLDKELEQDIMDLVVGSKKEGSSALPDIRQQLGKEKSKILDRVTELLPDATIPIEANDIYSISKLPTERGPLVAESQKYLDRILASMGLLDETGEIVNKTFDIKTASDISKQLADIRLGKSSKFKTEDPILLSVIKKLEQKFTDPIESLIETSGISPKYEAVNRAFGKIADTQSRLNVHDYYYGAAGKVEQDVKHMLSKIKQLENDRSLTGTAFKRETRLVQELVDSPDFALLPKNAQDSLSKAKNILDQLELKVGAKNLTLDAIGRTTSDSTGLMFLLNSYRALLTKGVNAALETGDNLKQFSDTLITPQGTKTIGKIGAGTKNAVDVDFYFNKLAEAANKHGNTELAKTIDYIGKQDMKKRRALTFVLMQQPGIRSILNEDKELVTDETK